MLFIKTIVKGLLYIICILLLYMGIRYAGQLPKKLYPLPYEEIVHRYAEKYDVDQYLIYSIMKAESNFDEQATSHKNALGLMQLTEPTANWAADKIGISLPTKKDILKPENNIQIGVWYFSYLLKEYDGDTTKALCAYNAGGTNVSKWLQEQKYSGDGVTLESIPFPETEKYVEKVYRYQNRYRKIYEE